MSHGASFLPLLPHIVHRHIVLFTWVLCSSIRFLKTMHCADKSLFPYPNAPPNIQDIRSSYFHDQNSRVLCLITILNEISQTCLFLYNTNGQAYPAVA